MVNKEFWKRKNVFITGNTGFKGSWLTFWLKSMGANVYGYSLDRFGGKSLETILGIEATRGDIRDMTHLSNALHAQPLDIVIHMAAQSLVSIGYEKPIETFRTNVIGTVILLEACRDIEGLQTILVVTTDKVYKESLTAHRESDPLGGYDPYSASKACAELVTTSYRKSFYDDEGGSFHPTILTVRAGNVIGGGDWASSRLIPDIMRHLYENAELNVRNVQATRPFQHVMDVLGGYMNLIECAADFAYEYGNACNFGPERSVSVKEVLDILEVSYTVEKYKPFHEAHVLELDSSLAVEELGWRSMSLENALLTTKRWYHAYYTGVDMKEYTMNFIREYEEGHFHG